MEATLFLSALALMLVFEGVMPFLSPEKWRQIMQAAVGAKDSTLRLFGLVSMLTGVLILAALHR